MAFFKFRTAGKDAKAGPRQAESIEVIRRRARHRLIGATVLVLVGVLGFPVLFDTQPRPISVDIPIEIPDRNQVKPLAVPARPATQAQPPAASGRVSPAPTATPEPRTEVVEATPKTDAAAPAKAASAATAQAPAAEAKLETKPDVKPPAKPEARPDAADDGAKAKALLDGKGQAAEGRFVVQVGAFADADKARETRARVERAGLKTYTHVAETKDGKRIRVRVGPFQTRGEADKAASKLKGLDLPAAILTL